MSTFENIKNHFLKKESSKKYSQKLYPIRFLFVGESTQQATDPKTGISFKYTHYDCFLGDSDSLGGCEKFKNLTTKPYTTIKSEQAAHKARNDSVEITDPNTQTTFQIRFPLDYFFILYCLRIQELKIYNDDLESKYVSQKYIDETFSKIHKYEKQQALNQEITNIKRELEREKISNLFNEDIPTK